MCNKRLSPAKQHRHAWCGREFAPRIVKAIPSDSNVSLSSAIGAYGCCCTVRICVVSVIMTLFFLNDVTEEFLEEKKIEIAPDQPSSGHFFQFKIEEPFCVATSPQNCEFSIQQRPLRRSKRITVRIKLTNLEDLAQLCKIDTALAKLCCGDGTGTVKYSNFVIGGDQIQTQVLSMDSRSSWNPSDLVGVAVSDFSGKNPGHLTAEEFIQMFNRQTAFCTLKLSFMSGWKDKFDGVTTYYPTVKLTEINLFHWQV